MRDYNHGDWKNRKTRSKKNCCCGGHNASNPKKNKKHHSTKMKLEHKKNRKMKEKVRNGMYNVDVAENLQQHPLTTGKRPE